MKKFMYYLQLKLYKLKMKLSTIRIRVRYFVYVRIMNRQEWTIKEYDIRGREVVRVNLYTNVKQERCECCYHWINVS